MARLTGALGEITGLGGAARRALAAGKNMAGTAGRAGMASRFGGPASDLWGSVMRRGRGLGNWAMAGGYSGPGGVWGARAARFGLLGAAGGVGAYETYKHPYAAGAIAAGAYGYRRMGGLAGMKAWKGMAFQ